MSCTSLVSYQIAGVNYVTTVLTYNVSGSYNVPGYTTPGWTTTTTIPAVSHWHQKAICIGGFTGGGCQTECTTTSVFSNQWCGPVCSSSRWNNCAYTTQIETETFTHPTNVNKHNGIPLWPSSSISASATINITFVSSATVSIPPPDGQTVVFAESMIINVQDLNVVFDSFDQPYVINIPVNEDITVTAGTDGFSAQIAIPGAPFPETDTTNGVTYGFELNPYILLCATPSPPVSYVNLVVDIIFTVSCNNPITNEPVSFNQSFSIACPAPIISE